MDESQLITRAREGDEQAFRTLYELHVDPLYRFLRQFSGNHDEVEEWVQRSFIRAYRALDRFKAQSRFTTWLFAIGLNEMRSDRRRPSMVILEGGMEASLQEDPSESFHWDDMMRGWLAELDETKRAVFLLHEVEGFSHAEIASMLDIGESASRTILTRTKQWLREQWNREKKVAG